ncbi:FecR family protein [Chitinophaga jiangningensis]|uniref:FecR family protein n=1 Tax=Chitinophaga jiangningensis TaxID=1419482 RepID=A0A1M7IZH7_9BACT|nr:FecR family protein [Chitinophaga jiangningensis]SHM46102.1 FecR family protein [Chitinophaga jiangningensis]
MESTAYYKYLITRYYNGTATPAETEELMAELRKHADDEQWQLLIQEMYAAETPDPAYDPASYEPAIQSILDAGKQTPVRRLWPRLAAAAAVLLLLGTSAWYIRHRSDSKPAATMAQSFDVKPGKEGAVLTLDDGSQVVLDSLQNGVVTNQHGASVVLQNGQLAYQGSGNGSSFNTMSTPKGRKFRLQLPDGTLVWMNAASSLRFPTAFTGSDRTVELSGEAYFEVAQQPNKPFRIRLAAETYIQVLGTSFNVNAYTDENNMSTTLLQGAVKIERKGRVQLLKPGQQLQLDQHNSFTIVNNADTAAVMAWKNGILNFQDKKLTAVMRLLERWYDIEVVYQGTPPDVTFYGEIGCDVNLASVLNFLQESGITFSMENNKLIVGPKTNTK